ncbi:MAG TPA: Fic family protein [Polyangia bacterium]
MDSKLFELDGKMDALRTRMGSFPARITKDYQDRLDFSWVFHDHALEGVVLSYSELKAAVDQRIISDVTLIPMYEEVRNHKAAVDYIREAAAQKKRPAVTLDLVKKLYGIVTPEAVAKGAPYRKENPLHRLYYHEIAPPEKIAAKMKKIEEWLESSDFLNLHPIVQASKFQYRLLAAYPWTKNTGKVARLLANYILLSNGYLPAIIHSIERQRYYEALRHENDGLTNLILESLQNSIETTVKFYDELEGLKIRRAS